MEDLLKPEYGLIFWTIVNFLILVFVLGKFAWKPMMKMLDERENRIAKDKADAQTAREQAEKIKNELDVRLKNISAEAQAKMDAVLSTANAQSDALIKDARDNAANILKTASQQLEAEKQKAVADARKEIVDISLSAAAKFIGESNSAEKDAAAVEKFIGGAQ